MPNVYIRLFKSYTINSIVLLMLFSCFQFVNCCVFVGKEQLEQRMCKDKECPFYGKCKLSEHTLEPICVCPHECEPMVTNSSLLASNFGFSYGYGIRDNELLGQTVCGNDGNNYKNFCELQRESCLSNKEIKIFYYGKCSKPFFILLLTITSLKINTGWINKDPCDDVSCPYPQTCRLNTNRQPMCMCNYDCSSHFKPVCGTNGKTYFNECHMRLESCRTNRVIRVFHHGECSEGKNTQLSSL